MVSGVFLSSVSSAGGLPPRKDPPRLYFSSFLPLSDPRNAQNLVEKRFFYMAAEKFDVYGFFNNFIALKPAIIEHSADLIAQRFGALSQINLKELGAGTGESLAILLGHLQNKYPALYPKVRAMASDGYPQVVDNLRRSVPLQPFYYSGKLVAAVEDLSLTSPSSFRGEYARVSCVLCELPEDTVRFENGHFQIAHVRGYIDGNEPFISHDGKAYPAKSIQSFLSMGSLRLLISLGILPANLNPRIRYETEWRPINFSSFDLDGPAVEKALQHITAGIHQAEFKLGLSGARVAETILRSHLSNQRGSYMELFDSWTAEIVEGMPCAILDYGLTTVPHPNYPFLKAYLEAKGSAVNLKFENWYEYTGAKEPYIYLHPFYKWLKSVDQKEFSQFFGRDLWGSAFESKRGHLVKHLSDTQLKYEEVLESENDHQFIKLLENYGLSSAEISLIFKSAKFVEQFRSRSDGFFGNYQVVTIEIK